METTVPISYEFPGHELRAVEPRRLITPPVDHGFAYYSHHPVTFAPPHLSSLYDTGHVLNNHSSTYPQFIGGSGNHIHPQPSRLLSEPPLSHTFSGFRQAKNEPLRVPRDTRARMVDDLRSGAQINRMVTDSPPGMMKKESPSSNTAEVDFSTGVDILMKTIQSRPEPPQQQLPSFQHFTHGPGNYSLPATTFPGPMQQQNHLLVAFQDQTPTIRQRPKRKHQCTLPNCGKYFTQKTHLDIHMRAHTGDKPFVCKEPSCGQRFSQLGNLKTHERRHTGEKPYSCDICHKRFAQRGNVRAHRVTHEQTKPYVCPLDNCWKHFTQLGNLKSHQNKFHGTTLRSLTAKFASGEMMTTEDLEMWKYFANNYRNSNKGIKGRGKDRKISCTAKSALRSSDEGTKGALPSESDEGSISSSEEEEEEEGEEEEEEEEEAGEGELHARYYLKRGP